MKTHKFDVEDAVKYGVNKAILLEHLRFHQQANQGNSDLTFDGKPYAFIKPETIEKMYPYFSYDSIRRWLRELEEDGIIVSIKPKAKIGNHLKYYHLILLNVQNDQSNGQNDQSKNGQNDQSSILPNMDTTYEYISVGNGRVDGVSSASKESAIRVAQYLLDAICETDPTHRYVNNTPSLDSWVVDIEKAIRIDGRTEDQFKFMIDAVFRECHRFSELWGNWYMNIQSGYKLRIQFDKIKNQIIASKNGTTRKQTKGDRDAEILRNL